MSKEEGRWIIFLLAAILGVLLVGRDAALGMLGSAFWGIAILAILGIAIWLFLYVPVYMAKAAKDEVKQLRTANEPWLWMAIIFVALPGNFIVLGYAIYRYFDRSCRDLRGDCLSDIPYYWLPIALIALALVVMLTEKLLRKLFRQKIDE